MEKFHLPLGMVLLYSWSLLFDFKTKNKPDIYIKISLLCREDEEIEKAMWRVS